MARKVVSDAKRDLVQTGNKKLRPSTVRTLQGGNALVALRSRMGSTATGFKTKHCMLTQDANIYFIEYMTDLFYYSTGSDSNQKSTLERLRCSINKGGENENEDEVLNRFDLEGIRFFFNVFHCFRFFVQLYK